MSVVIITTNPREVGGEAAASVVERPFRPRDYFFSAGVAVAGPMPTISRTTSPSFAPS
jgi:hypothetical protein